MLFVPAAVQAQEKPLAFPGAEGFGRYATGGRNGQIYHVTNLNDSGEGSLRDAVSQSNRIVVFDVSGVIKLKSALIFKGNLTVLGQTAPGEGIQVYGNRVSFSGANNLIVQHMRFRMGKGGDSGKDACGIANGQDMIFDHISALWGRDECFSVNWDNKGTEPANITIQNSIIGQGLQTHSCGGLMQTNGGVTLYRNLYIENKTRNPKVKGLNQFVNNVVYNWGGGGCYLMGGDSEGNSWADLRNNYFVKGPWEANVSPFSNGNEKFQFYSNGNIYDDNKNGVADGTAYTGTGGGNQVSSLNAFTGIPKPHPAISNLMSAQDALEWIIENVGPTLPVRDEVDQYLIDELTSYGTKGTTNGISSEKELPHGGTGALYSGEKPLDSDGDGIPDEWEDAHGLNKNDASDAAKLANDGYANIEKYAHSITGPYPYIKNPSELKATKQEMHAIELTWKDNAGSKPGDINEDNYIIEMSEDNQTFDEIARVESGVTTYRKDGLKLETVYYFRVRAYNEASNLYSPYCSLTTETIGEPAKPDTCNTPSPEIGKEIGVAAGIELSWNNPTKNYYGVVKYDVYVGLEKETLERVASDLTEKSFLLTTDIITQVDTTYYWRVDAKNNEGTTTGNVWSFKAIEGGTLFYTDFYEKPDAYYQQYGNKTGTNTNIISEGSANKTVVVGGMTFGSGPKGVRIAHMGNSNNSADPTKDYGPATESDAGASDYAVQFVTEKSGGYLQLPEVDGPCTITLYIGNAGGKAYDVKLKTIIDGTESDATTFSLAAQKKIFMRSYTYTGKKKVIFKVDANAAKINLNDVLIEQYVPVIVEGPIEIKTYPDTINYMDGSMTFTFNQDIQYLGGASINSDNYEKISVSGAGQKLTVEYEALDVNTEYAITFPEGSLIDLSGEKMFTDEITFSTRDFAAAKAAGENHWGKAAVNLPLDFKPFDTRRFAQINKETQASDNDKDYPHWVQASGGITADEAVITDTGDKIMAYFNEPSAAIEVAADYEGTGNVEFKIQETRNPDNGDPTWRTIRVLRKGDFPFHEVLPLNTESRFIKLTATSLGGGKVKVSELKIADAEGNGINKPEVKKDFTPKEITPADTATLYYLKEFILSFEKTTKLQPDSTATIISDTDTLPASITKRGNDVFAITLSDTLFTVGEYTLTIPEGTFGDPTYIDDPTTGHCNPELSYTYTIKEVDALDENIADNMVVTVADGTVTVSGVPAGEQVDVIDLSGRIIASQKAADGKATFSLQRGFYLLKTATRTFKVSL